MGNKSSKQPASFDDHVREKYGMRPAARVQSNRNYERLRDEDESSSHCCIKFKAFFISALIFGPIGFVGGWVFFAKPWQTSNETTPANTHPQPHNNTLSHITTIPYTFACPLVSTSLDVSNMAANDTVILNFSFETPNETTDCQYTIEAKTESNTAPSKKSPLEKLHDKQKELREKSQTNNNNALRRLTLFAEQKHPEQTRLRGNDNKLSHHRRS